MAQQRQNVQRDTPVPEPEAPRGIAPARRTVMVLIAILMALVVGIFASQLRLSTPKGDDTPGQLVVRQDGGLIPIESNSAHDTTRWSWMVASTELKLLARLAVYMALVLMVVAPMRAAQKVASTKADKEKDEAIAALQELQKKHTFLEAKSTQTDQVGGLTEKEGTESEPAVSASREVGAEIEKLQLEVAQLQAKLAATAAAAAARDANAIASRAPTTSECRDAIWTGNVDVLKLAKEAGRSFDAIREDEDACVAAARNGNLDVLNWLRANGCPWDESICGSAAKNGHLEVIQWSRANGCSWNAWTCFWGAQNGHIEVLQWLRDNGCPWDRSACFKAASELNRREVKMWISIN